MIWHAQTVASGVRLDSCGGRGGPAHLAAQPLEAGRWNLYDAWIGLAPGSCGTRRADQKRAQIARGQELFNEKRSATGGRCVGCHNAVNNGTRVDGLLFDIKTSDPAFATADMPVYTVRNLLTGETRGTTDPGKAFVSGKWNDLNRFKAPTLRGLSSRAPYFHNGIAATLQEVVRHYEVALGFDFSASEEADLVAFLEAL
jgi:cytochrome c peroxidase